MDRRRIVQFHSNVLIKLQTHVFRQMMTRPKHKVLNNESCRSLLSYQAYRANQPLGLLGCVRALECIRQCCLVNSQHIISSLLIQLHPFSAALRLNTNPQTPSTPEPCSDQIPPPYRRQTSPLSSSNRQGHPHPTQSFTPTPHTL